MGCVSFPEENEENQSGEKPYSQFLARMIDDEARKLVNKAYDEAEKILRDNKDKLAKVRLF